MISETKSWFFEKINKIDKPLISLIKKKREKTQVNKIRNERGEITPGTTGIQRMKENTINKYMPISWKIWKKWINSQKLNIFHDGIKMKQNAGIDPLQQTKSKQ